MRPREKYFVLPRGLTVGNGLDEKLRHAIIDDGESSVFGVNSVECFRQRERRRPVCKSHRVDAVQLTFPGMQIGSRKLCRGGGGRMWFELFLGRVLW